MMSISSSEAFLILGKWRDNKAQLQIGFFKPGKNAGTPGVITDTSPKDETIEALIVVNGQTAKWRFPLRGASFQYGEPADSAVFPEFAEGKWSSYLVAELPDGNTILFAERFAEENHS
jgi:hypothetical protein